MLACASRFLSNVSQLACADKLITVAQANARQLIEWYDGLLSRMPLVCLLSSAIAACFLARTPRQMSERPQATPSGKLWRRFVNLGLEEP